MKNYVLKIVFGIALATYIMPCWAMETITKEQLQQNIEAKREGFNDRPTDSDIITINTINSDQNKKNILINMQLKNVFYTLINQQNKIERSAPATLNIIYEQENSNQPLRLSFVQQNSAKYSYVVPLTDISTTTTQNLTQLIRLANQHKINTLSYTPQDIGKNFEINNDRFTILENKDVAHNFFNTFSSVIKNINDATKSYWLTFSNLTNPALKKEVMLKIYEPNVYDDFDNALHVEIRKRNALTAEKLKNQNEYYKNFIAKLPQSTQEAIATDKEQFEDTRKAPMRPATSIKIENDKIIVKFNDNYFAFFDIDKNLTSRADLGLELYYNAPMRTLNILATSNRSKQTYMIELFPNNKIDESINNIIGSILNPWKTSQGNSLSNALYSMKKDSKSLNIIQNNINKSSSIVDKLNFATTIDSLVFALNDISKNNGQFIIEPNPLIPYKPLDPQEKDIVPEKSLAGSGIAEPVPEQLQSNIMNLALASSWTNVDTTLAQLQTNDPGSLVKNIEEPSSLQQQEDPNAQLNQQPIVQPEPKPDVVIPEQKQNNPPQSTVNPPGQPTQQVQLSQQQPGIPSNKWAPEWLRKHLTRKNAYKAAGIGIVSALGLTLYYLFGDRFAQLKFNK